MAVRYNWNNMAERVLGETTLWALESAHLSADSLCPIYQSQPGRFITGVIDTPFSNALHGVWDTLCEPRGQLPLPPVTLFGGGQCPVQYRFIAEGEFRRNSDGQVFPVNRNIIVNGPVGGIQFNRDDADSGTFFLTTGSGPVALLIGFNYQTNTWIEWVVLSVTRLDGQPDNCGDPPPQFPPVPVIPVNQIVNQIFNDGSEFEFELNFDPPNNPDDSLGRIDFEFGGINISFDGGGVVLDLPTLDGGDFSSSDRTTLNEINANVEQIINEGVDCNCDNTEVLNAIQSLRDYVAGRFDSIDDVLQCIEARVKMSQRLKPVLSEPPQMLVMGETSSAGESLYVSLPSSNSSFLIIDLELLPFFRERIYQFRNTELEIEAAFGHVELGFDAGSPRASTFVGLNVLNSRFSLLEFPPESPVNVARLSLRGRLGYMVIDPGYRWEIEDPEECL